MSKGYGDDFGLPDQGSGEVVAEHLVARFAGIEVEEFEVEGGKLKWEGVESSARCL